MHLLIALCDAIRDVGAYIEVSQGEGAKEVEKYGVHLKEAKQKGEEIAGVYH